MVICVIVTYLGMKETGGRKGKERKVMVKLPGKVLRGTPLADGSVNMGRVNPQPKGRTQILGRLGLLLYPR